MITERSRYYSKYIFKLKTLQDHLNALMRKYNRWYNNTYISYVEKEADGEPTGLAGVHILIDHREWKNRVRKAEKKVKKIRKKIYE